MFFCIGYCEVDLVKWVEFVVILLENRLWFVSVGGCMRWILVFGVVYVLVEGWVGNL